MKSEYAKREVDRRFAIYCNGIRYYETLCFGHMQHVLALLRHDGYKADCVTLTANQESAERLNKVLTS